MNVFKKSDKEWLVTLVLKIKIIRIFNCSNTGDLFATLEYSKYSNCSGGNIKWILDINRKQIRCGIPLRLRDFRGILLGREAGIRKTNDVWKFASSQGYSKIFGACPISKETLTRNSLPLIGSLNKNVVRFDNSTRRLIFFRLAATVFASRADNWTSFDV